MRSLLLFLCSLTLFSCELVKSKSLQQGDIVFHTSKSSQSKAIQLATNSPYSHCGIVFIKDGNVFVYEAVQPVKLTSLSDWIKKGEKEHYVVKRLKNSESILTKENLNKLYNAGLKYQGRDYDHFFQWSDDKIYCSELVWKVYHNALNLKLTDLESFGDFDFSHPQVREKLQERFHGNIPKKEQIVSPKALFLSDKLETVYESN